MADGVLVTDVLEGHGLLPDEATVDAAGHVTASLATMEHPGHVRPGGHDPQDREDDGNSPLQEDGIRQERGHDCGCQRPDGTEQGVERHVVHLEQQQAHAQRHPGDDHLLPPEPEVSGTRPRKMGHTACTVRVPRRGSPCAIRACPRPRRSPVGGPWCPCRSPRGRHAPPSRWRSRPRR